MKKKSKLVNLGLQGGGSHGAFGWGVLDYFLEDGRLDFEGLSSTSAGSMNAVVLAQGLLGNDRDEARQALHDFWKTISDFPQLLSLEQTCHWPGLESDQFSLDRSLFYNWFEMISHLFSPYQFNPLNFNPLKHILEAQIDFDRIKNESQLRMFICATNVQTGKIKIFKKTELSVDVVLASACLPLIFQAVEIEGEHYWDGGYMGNPAIYPLIYECTSPDVVILHINPIVRNTLPTTAEEILNRINEISFNSSLMREMRAVAFVTELIDSHAVEGRGLKKMFIHSIRSDQEMASHHISSKLNTEWKFLTYLRDRGRHTAKIWLEQNWAKIGKKSSIDIRKEFL